MECTRFGCKQRKSYSRNLDKTSKPPCKSSPNFKLPNTPGISSPVNITSINTTNKETQINKTIRLSKKNNLPGPCNYTITIENLEKTILPRTIGFFFSKQCKLKKLEDNKNKKKKEIAEKYLPEVIYKKITEFLIKKNNVEHKTNENPMPACDGTNCIMISN